MHTPLPCQIPRDYQAPTPTEGVLPGQSPWLPLFPSSRGSGNLYAFWKESTVQWEQVCARILVSLLLLY